jgi:hypothetical protein
MARTFVIDITVEHGQLHESLNSVDRKEMIVRLDEILSNTRPENQTLRDGVIQILIDQLTNDDGHEPIIIRTGEATSDGEDEQLVWQCDYADIEVEIDKYRETDRTKPKNDKADKNPFRFTEGKKGRHVRSFGHTNRSHSIEQKFYKFSIKGKDRLQPPEDANDLVLDPCVICEK